MHDLLCLSKCVTAADLILVLIRVPHLWTPDSGFFSLPADTSATLQGASSLQLKTEATSLVSWTNELPVALWLSSMQMAKVDLSSLQSNKPRYYVYIQSIGFYSLKTPNFRGGCCVANA